MTTKEMNALIHKLKQQRHFDSTNFDYGVKGMKWHHKKNQESAESGGDTGKKSKVEGKMELAESGERKRQAYSAMKKTKVSKQNIQQVQEHCQHFPMPKGGEKQLAQAFQQAFKSVGSNFGDDDGFFGMNANIKLILGNLDYDIDHLHAGSVYGKGDMGTARFIVDVFYHHSQNTKDAMENPSPRELEFSTTQGDKFPPKEDMYKLEEAIATNLSVVYGVNPDKSGKILENDVGELQSNDPWEE